MGSEMCIRDRRDGAALNRCEEFSLLTFCWYELFIHTRKLCWVFRIIGRCLSEIINKPKKSLASEARDMGFRAVGRTQLTTWQILRKYAEHEDTLLHQRSNWLLVSTGFLFAGAGFRLRAHEVDSIRDIPSDIMLIGIAVMGLCISAASGFAIHAAIRSIRNLAKTWTNLIPRVSEQVVVAVVPPIAGGGVNRAEWQGRLTAYLLPLTFTCF